MARSRRYLIPRDIWNTEDPAAALADLDRQLAATPAAAQYTDEEVQTLLEAASFLDNVGRKSIINTLKNARIPYPPELTFNEYRLCRHVLYRWHQPGLQQAFFRHFNTDYGRIAKLRRRRDMRDMLDVVDEYGAPILFSILRRVDIADMIPNVLTALSPDQALRYELHMRIGRLLLHECLTEPGPSRQPTRWEQRKLIRRIRLREVQLHSLNRNLHTLHGERRQLLARLRELDSFDRTELETLAAELDQIRTQRADAERRHAADLAEQARLHAEAMAQLQTELTAILRDQSETLAVRRSWLPLRKR